MRRVVCYLVAESFLSESILSLDEDYRICRPGEMTDDWKRRTIMIYGVSERMEDTLKIILQSAKYRGGSIQSSSREKRTGLMTVTFQQTDGLLSIWQLLLC